MRASGAITTLAATVIIAALASVLRVVAGPASFAVVDGDTLRRDKESYRLLGIDAAEIHRAQCDAERRLGELTKHRLEALLRSGQVVLHPDPPTKRDKYGRLLVHLLVDGEDAACVLIREGYARPLARAARGLVHRSLAGAARRCRAGGLCHDLVHAIDGSE